MGAITLSVNHWINHVFFPLSKNLTSKKFLLIWPFFEHHIDSQKGSSKFAEVQKKGVLKDEVNNKNIPDLLFKFYKPNLIIVSLFFSLSVLSCKFRKMCCGERNMLSRKNKFVCLVYLLDLYYGLFCCGQDSQRTSSCHVWHHGVSEGKI